MHRPRLSRYLSGVSCYACSAPHDSYELLSVCTRCDMPLRVDYDLSSIRLTLEDVRELERVIKLRKKTGRSK